MIIDRNFTIGGLFAFVTYSMYVMGPVSAILNIGYSFSGILPSAKRLFGFLALDIEDDNGNENVHEVHGSIRFEDVSFCYRQKEQVLNSISFDIKPGEKVW